MSENAAAKQIKRDRLWEALVEVCRADATQMTKSERGRYNKALKELREVGATPDQIRSRAARWRGKYPELELTPTALTAQWSALAPPQPRPRHVPVATVSDPGEITPEQRAANLARLREASRVIKGVGDE